MMTRQKLIFATSALVLAAAMLPASYAQDQQGPPPMQMQGGGGRQMNPERQLKHLTRELNLNSDQQREAHHILKQRDEQIESLRQNTALPPRQMHEQMRSIMMESDGKLRGLLNPDQQQKFDAMRAQQREKMEERHGGMGQQGAPAPPQGPPPADRQAPPPQQ